MENGLSLQFAAGLIWHSLGATLFLAFVTKWNDDLMVGVFCMAFSTEQSQQFYTLGQVLRCFHHNLG